MKKILYLHGFLGLPEDMKPLFLEGFDCEAYDLRKLLKSSSPIEKLASETGVYTAVVGYSFGGRILEELKTLSPDKSQKWIFCSSRHTTYPKKELSERKIFKENLEAKVNDSLDQFYEYWETLPLFSTHSMKSYRGEHKINKQQWSEKEISLYLENFFNSPQNEPVQDKNVYYFYGEQDKKYSLEAERLEPYFNIESFSNCGHRAIFEDVVEFKKKLKIILDV